MKRYLKSITLLAATLLTITATKAQNATDTISLVVSGQGATLEEARTNALRSAIEQAYGTFISTKTELLNDSLVKDEVVSVANGNILGYEIQSQVSIPGGSYGITLRAMVSLKKLTSFVESKGGSVDIKGGVFAANIKLKLLNEKAELAAVLNICDVSWEILSKSVDFDLKVGDNPQLVDKEKQIYSLPIVVNATTNENLESFYNYLIESLQSLSIRESELNSYTELNINYFTITYDSPTSMQPIVKIYLRNEQSQFALSRLFLKSPVFFYSFKLISNLDTIQLGKKYPINAYDSDIGGKPIYYYDNRNPEYNNIFFYCMDILNTEIKGQCDELISIAYHQDLQEWEKAYGKKERKPVSINYLFHNIIYAGRNMDIREWFGGRNWNIDNNNNYLRYIISRLHNENRYIIDIIAVTPLYINNRFNHETKKISPLTFTVSINKTLTLNELENLNGYRVERNSLWQGKTELSGDSKSGTEEDGEE